MDGKVILTAIAEEPDGDGIALRYTDTAFCFKFKPQKWSVEPGLLTPKGTFGWHQSFFSLFSKVLIKTGMIYSHVGGWLDMDGPETEKMQ
jgi:hypothetical protein